MKKAIKRTASILIILLLTVSMTLPALASEVDDPTGLNRVAPISEVHYK